MIVLIVFKSGEQAEHLMNGGTYVLETQLWKATQKASQSPVSDPSEKNAKFPIRSNGGLTFNAGVTSH